LRPPQAATTTDELSAEHVTMSHDRIAAHFRSSFAGPHKALMEK
jgi:hypothetical protein